MSKIKINQVSDTEIEVNMNGDVPLEMAEQLVKSFEAKGMVEDKSKSSLTQRFYFKPETFDVADELIKTLEGISKGDNTWWGKDPKQKEAYSIQRRRQNTADAIRRQTTAARAAQSAPIAPSKATTPSTPQNITVAPNRPFVPSLKKEEDHKKNDAKCPCAKCKVARKASHNKSLREKLFGNSWGEHMPFPSAHQPGTDKKLPTGEGVQAQQLADLMMNKGMMKPRAGVPLLGSVVPPQPTDEQLFGHLVPTEEMIKAAEAQYAGGINGFYAEAMKPINSRFKSEEEELAYWRSIKVNPGSSEVD